MPQQQTDIINKQTGDELSAYEFNRMVEVIDSNSNSGTVYGHIGVTNDLPFVTSSNQFQDVDTWTIDIKQDGTYNIHVTVEWRLSATNQDAIFRFDVNGQTGIEINQEPKDGSNNIFFTTFALTELNAGINTIELKARKESSNSSNLTINSNRYTAQKIDILS